MDSSRDLLREIDAFLDRTGMTQTEFGKAVMNNTSFVRQIRRGGGITLRTMDRVRAFIAEWKEPKGKGRNRPNRRAEARAA